MHEACHCRVLHGIKTVHMSWRLEQSTVLVSQGTQRFEEMGNALMESGKEQEMIHRELIFCWLCCSLILLGMLASKS